MLSFSISCAILNARLTVLSLLVSSLCPCPVASHSSLTPEAVQTEIRSRFAVAVVGSKPKVPAVRAEVDLANLTNKQRAVADARMAIIAKVLELEDSGMSRIKAVEFFCDLAKSGELPEEVAELVAVANAKKNAKPLPVKRLSSGYTVRRTAPDYLVSIRLLIQRRLFLRHQRRHCNACRQSI